MILSTRGKLAANAVEDRFGKGFPADLVRRTRALLAALDAAVVLEEPNHGAAYVNGSVKVSQRAAQNVATLGLA